MPSYSHPFLVLENREDDHKTSDLISNLCLLVGRIPLPPQTMFDPEGMRKFWGLQMAIIMHE